MHEAWLRLVPADGRRSDASPRWDGGGHFFAAAAEAMRRILVENARRKQALKYGGNRRRLDLDIEAPEAAGRDWELLVLDEALERLEAIDADKARLVKLRYFAGLTIDQAAESLGVSVTTANRWWAYARAWLHEEIRSGD